MAETERGMLAPEEAEAARLLQEYQAALEAGRAPDRERLLAAHPELSVCLDALDFVHGAVPQLRASGGGDAPGTIGDFRIVREIGRGGMGVVYEAEQISLGRRVALKVLPFAAVLDPKQLQRFKNEALAAAHLHHPHIVPVHSVGCERGVHYYAMQLIEGQSLSLAIRGMRGGGTGEGPRTPITSHGSNREPGYIRMAAALGAQAAEALDHAHQLGIVHRDVKPGNLLVDEEGTLWITDFGLARSLKDVGLTITGELLGTVRYMSPEQALARRVPVDHRTDVYSLGATLYELFTLEPAFPGDDPHRVIQDIASREPTVPRRLNPALPVDLETVLLKAMAKDAAGRYATAQEMADDLRRYLEDKPVLARRPSIAARAARWARRHRGLVAGAAAILVVAVAALAIGATNLASERRAAEDNLQLARDSVDRFLVGIGVRGLKDARVPTPVRQDLLSRALGFYEGYVARRTDAGALTTVGNILGALGRWEHALTAYDRAIAVDPDAAAAHSGRGSALSDLRRIEDAFAAYDRATALDPKSAHPYFNRGVLLESLGRRDEALEAYDRAIALDPDLASAHNNRGGVLLQLGRSAEALAASERAIALDPYSANSYNNCGAALQALDRLQEALVAYDRAIALVPELALAHCNRGQALELLGRHAEALAAEDRAIELNPLDAVAHQRRGNALHSLGRHSDALEAHERAAELDPKSGAVECSRANDLASLGREEEALTTYGRAIDLDPTDAMTFYNFGRLLELMGRHEEALVTLDRAIQLNSNDADFHVNRGIILEALERREEALAACDCAIAVDPKSARGYYNRGVLLGSLGRHEPALASFDRAIALDPNDPKAWNNRGFALENVGRYWEALAACDRAIQLSPTHASAHLNRGDTLQRLGHPDEAVAAYDRAIDLGARSPMLLNDVAWGRATSVDPRVRNVRRAVELAKEAARLAPEQGVVWNTLGVALVRSEAWREALGALEKSMELRDGGDAVDRLFIAMAMWHLDQKEQARVWYDRAIGWMEQNSKTDDEELKRFRDEAAALLGVK